MDCDPDFWSRVTKVFRRLSYLVAPLYAKYKVCRVMVVWDMERQKMYVFLTKLVDCDLDLWPTVPQNYRYLPYPILQLCAKYEVYRLKTFWVIARHKSVDGRTDGQTDGQTDRRTDGQSDYYRAPHQMMRGPNNLVLYWVTYYLITMVYTC